MGKDVAEVLGYSDTKDALAKHVDPEDKRQDDGVAICDPMGREQHPTIINESSLYSLVRAVRPSPALFSCPLCLGLTASTSPPHAGETR